MNPNAAFLEMLFCLSCVGMSVFYYGKYRTLKQIYNKAIAETTIHENAKLDLGESLIAAQRELDAIKVTRLMDSKTIKIKVTSHINSTAKVEDLKESLSCEILKFIKSNIQYVEQPNGELEAVCFLHSNPYKSSTESSTIDLGIF